jgi:hypothetical protein
MSSCMDQDRPWEEQPSRDYHNEIRAERDRYKAALHVAREALKLIAIRDVKRGGCTSEDAWEVEGPFSEIAYSAVLQMDKLIEGLAAAQEALHDPR